MVRWVSGIELLCALPGTKKQKFVFDYRTARSKAILILPQNAARLVRTIRKPVIGVEIFVPEILEQRYVEIVGATFRNDIDVSPGIASRRGIKQGRLHFEFLNRVGIGSRDPRRINP